MATASLFDTTNFMPHGMCYLWQEDILWTSVISDVTTALAYFSITAAMIIFVKKRQDLPYPWFFILSGSIIFMACGTSHLISAIVIWKPIYGISAIVKMITAITSLVSGVVIWFLLPFFLSIPSPSMLKRKNEELQESLDKLSIAQESLVESEKMASLGNLVSGVAHEINTPLGVAITAVSISIENNEKLKQNLSQNKITKEQLIHYHDEIDKSSTLINYNLNRTAKLVTSFKQIAVDHSEEQFRQFNLKKYISKVAMTLNAILRDTQHTMTIECDDDIEIFGDPSAITQIITNLVMNSVKHGFENTLHGDIKILASEKEQNVLFTYQDSGCGISEQNKAKLFEPFFTTKRGRGSSGLGMYIVYNLVSQSLNGTIDCTSELGQGIKFSLEFPTNSTI